MRQWSIYEKLFASSREHNQVGRRLVSPIKSISSSLCSSPRMPRLSCNSELGVTILPFMRTDYTDIASLWYRRSVPTEDQILVPETLLKKRKSQEKQREERSAELEKKKKVGLKLPSIFVIFDGERGGRW